MDGTLGEIRIWAADFAPRGWAFCHGQMLSPAQHPALYSLLSTNYGGNGRETYGLPDLRGRVPIGVGQGKGLDHNINLGMQIGQETVTVTGVDVQSHSHSKATDVSESTTHVASGGNEYGTQQPSLGLNYIICVAGNFPNRS